MSLLRCRDVFACEVLKCALLVAMGAVSVPGWAQAAGVSGAGAEASVEAGKPAEKRTFEAVSVRPGSRNFINRMDFLDPVNKATPPKGGLYSWNVPAAYLIYFAYDIRSPQLRRAVWEQLQKSSLDQSYAVEARAEGDPSRDDVRAMVRSLLEERFKLAAHSGIRYGQVNALTVVKPGVGLKPHAAGAPCELTLPKTDWAYPPYKDFPVRCGIFDRELSKYKRRIEFVDVTMQQVADTLSQHSQLAVVDATALTGHYDGFLDYGPEMLPPDADPSVDAGPPVSVGLEKQLGMKLVKRNANVDYFVIDHIEKPSEN